MFLELTEMLVCPACPSGRAAEGRAPQGLVARVDRMEGRRVLSGFLGCPRCEARYPIRSGVVRFGERPAPGASAGDEPADVASMVAALLGLDGEAAGYALLGPGLTGVAARLAAAGQVEVVALGAPPRGAGGEGEPAGGDDEERMASAGPLASFLDGVDPAALPLVSGRFRGVALLGGAPGSVGEAARVLSSRGRLVLLSPTAEGRAAASGSGLEVVADEERALVALRR